MEGSRFGSCLKISRYSFQRDEGQIGCQTSGSRELPHGMFCPSFGPEIIHPPNEQTSLTCVETFPGAACLKSFAVMHTPRQTSLVSQARSKAAPLHA